MFPQAIFCNSNKNISLIQWEWEWKNPVSALNITFLYHFIYLFLSHQWLVVFKFWIIELWVFVNGPKITLKPSSFRRPLLCGYGSTSGSFSGGDPLTGPQPPPLLIARALLLRPPWQELLKWLDGLSQCISGQGWRWMGWRHVPLPLWNKVTKKALLKGWQKSATEPTNPVLTVKRSRSIWPILSP